MVKAKKPLPPRSTHSLAKFGLSVSDWKKMLEAQGMVCAICRKGGKLKHLSVEHDHTIERKHGVIVVNGLVCQRCNGGLARFEWSDEVLIAVIKYMQKILRNRKKYDEEDRLA